MRKILLFALFLLILAGTAHAVDVPGAQQGALELDMLENAAGEYAPEAELAQGVSLDEGLSGLLERGGRELGGVVRKAMRSGVLLLVVALLCSLAGGLGEAGGKVFQAAPIAGALAIAAIAVTDANTLIGLGRGAISNIDAFSKVLLPTVTAAAAASGAPAGALARQLATLLFSDVLITLINRLLLPLCYGYIAVCTAHAALGNEGLKRVAGTLKWVVSSTLTAVLLIFVGYLTVSGVIAGTADAATIKAAKFAMSSAVPVVGSILSDAAETVLAGAGILRNTVGIFGMLTVLGICLLPFLQLGIHYITYKIAAALSATVSGGTTVALIDNIGGAFGLVLGMMGSCALLLLVSLVSSISIVVH